MTPLHAALSALALISEPASPGGLEVYANRIALAAADEACALFSPAERALLEALAARSRDDAARAGAAPEALDRFEQGNRSEPESCETAEAGAQRHLDHAAALAATAEIAFPGLHQDWVSERRLRTTPLWRLRQASAASPAMLGIHAGEETDQLALAVRLGAPPAYAVLVMRDPARQAEPVDFTAGGLLAAPFDDPISAWGGAAGAERRFTNAGRLDPDMAARLAPASGETAYAFTFPESAIEALRRLAPRDGVRVELIGARGAVIERLWFEAGMFNAALAVQALPLPEPEQPGGPQTASASR